MQLCTDVFFTVLRKNKTSLMPYHPTLLLPSEQHQIGIQYNRHHEMTKRDKRHREDCNKYVDAPKVRRKPSQEDQHGRPENADGERELKPFDDTRNLLEESDIFYFLGRGAPRHVDAEHV